MAWTATYTQNTDIPGVGIVTALDGDSGFYYSRRVKTASQSDCSNFAAEAQAGLQKFIQQQADALKAQGDATATILKELNAP